MKKIGVGLTAVVIILLVLGGKWAYDNFTVELPDYPPIEKVVWLDQNWSPEQRDWFHHADQGTQTFGIPYEWFTALEQPPLSTTASGLLSDSLYLDRYGFIPDNTHPDKPELPIGFAHGSPLVDSDGSPVLNPQTKAPMTSLGLTCAACHTGRFTYQGTAVLIDGGPALTNLDAFQNGVALAMIYTQHWPGRFDRFAERVLGPRASAEAKSQLREQLDQVVSLDLKIHGFEEKAKHQTVEKGFARLDALNRIGNFVFAVDMNTPANFVGYSAPVHFPRIWNAYWFEWIQYNGSIEQPMTRNAGEALGVRAAVNLTGPKDALYSSTVRVGTLSDIEHLLAGSPPNVRSGFNGLRSPEWPENILPPIDTKLAAEGAVLYQMHCKGCHLPPTSDPGFWTTPEWSAPNAAGERYLDLHLVDIDKVGTDPAQAEDMKDRTIAVPASLGFNNGSGQAITSEDYGGALRHVVTAVVSRWYNGQVPPTPQAERDKMNGFRPDNVQAVLKYKARPLNGIWATPPYLHNGSVPNLYALLSPVAERPKTFYLGNREYDPVNVGYHTEPFPNGFMFDTSIRGNSNSGHEFNNGSGKGIIGPLLTPDERRALIEYLKTL